MTLEQHVSEDSCWLCTKKAAASHPWITTTIYLHGNENPTCTRFSENMPSPVIPSTFLLLDGISPFSSLSFCSLHADFCKDFHSVLMPSGPKYFPRRFRLARLLLLLRPEERCWRQAEVKLHFSNRCVQWTIPTFQNLAHPFPSVILNMVFPKVQNFHTGIVLEGIRQLPAPNSPLLWMSIATNPGSAGCSLNDTGPP